MVQSYSSGFAVAAQLTSALAVTPTASPLPNEPIPITSDSKEFRAAIMGYAEWGTRLALANSQADATPAPHAPVPRWGWGVAPPYNP